MKEEKKQCNHKNMVEDGNGLYCPDCNTVFKETMFGRYL